MTLPLSEAEFQATFVQALGVMGWAHCHVRRSIGKGRRWMTATSAIGWPDVLALRGPWLLAVELKSDAGKLTEEQVQWLGRFALLPHARTWVLRPSDPWDPITRWLQRPEEAPPTFGWPWSAGSTGAGPDMPPRPERPGRRISSL